MSVLLNLSSNAVTALFQLSEGEPWAITTSADFAEREMQSKADAAVNKMRFIFLFLICFRRQR